MSYKVDFTQIINNFLGDPFEETTVICPHCQGVIETSELTLRMMCVTALDFEAQGESIRSEDKFRRFELARRISQRDEIELTASEIVLLKGQIAKRYRAWVMGQAWEMLEPSQQEEQ